MRPVISSIALAAVLAMPAAAQDTETPDEGRSLIEEGARMLFEGLMQETKPAIEELQEMAERLGPQLRGFAEEMGPALAEILKDVEDLSVYEAPEQLPNGDIIIRRKEPLPEGGAEDDMPERPSPDAPMSEGEIEI